MEDSKDTVIIKKIGPLAEGEEFIKLLSNIGKIQTDKHTGERLAKMVPVKGKKFREGIATFEDATVAQEAVKQLNGKDLGGSNIKVVMAEQVFEGFATETVKLHDEHHNTAWSLWTQRIFMRNQATPQEGHPTVMYPQGGAGGKGGDGWFGYFRGQDGQPGESGPYGKGGEGGEGGKCGLS